MMNDKPEINEKFEQAIESFSEDIKELARQTRQLIHKTLPEVVEVVWGATKKYGLRYRCKEKNRTFLLAHAGNKSRHAWF